MGRGHEKGVPPMPAGRAPVLLSPANNLSGLRCPRNQFKQLTSHHASACSSARTSCMCDCCAAAVRPARAWPRRSSADPPLRPLTLKDLGEGALLLQVVALRARATQPRLAVNHHAHGPAIGAHGLHRERAVGPARPEFHGVERVDGAAAPLDLVAGVGRAPEAALAQHVVLVLAPPHGARHPPSRRRPARGPTCAHARRLHVFTEPRASRPRARILTSHKSAKTVKTGHRLRLRPALFSSLPPSSPGTLRRRRQGGARGVPPSPGKPPAK